MDFHFMKEDLSTFSQAYIWLLFVIFSDLALSIIYILDENCIEVFSLHNVRPTNFSKLADVRDTDARNKRNYRGTCYRKENGKIH